MEMVRLKLKTDEIDFTLEEDDKGFFRIVEAQSVTTGKVLPFWLCQVYQGEPGPTINHMQLKFKEAVKNARNN